MKEAIKVTRLELAGDRVSELLKVLEMMAAGDTGKRLEISDRHDELDAIAHGINVLVGELGWATTRVVEAEQDKSARAERESAAKNVFFRNLSHELRTPIAAMLGFADLLASGGPTQADRPEMLKRLQANGRAVLSPLGDEWTIDVTDTGIGIAPGRRTRIFEPFEQADDSISGSYGGNGLGLALSRKLADQLGGSLVLLYSAPGEGTTFRLTLMPLKA